MSIKLIADSGSTKAEWCVVKNNEKQTIFTQGISPYFLSTNQIVDLIKNELSPHIKELEVNEIHYYGTGCANPNNAKSVKIALEQVFNQASITVNHDLMAAA